MVPLASEDRVSAIGVGSRVMWTQLDWKHEYTEHSAVHRVYLPGRTYCNRDIPAERAFVPHHSLKPKKGKCGRCDRMHRQASRYHDLGGDQTPDTSNYREEFVKSFRKHFAKFAAMGGDSES